MGQFLQNLLPDKGQLFLCPSVQLEIRIAIETLNLLDIADLILESALLRAESRGGHYRGDYPETLAIGNSTRLFTVERGAELLCKLN